MHEAAQTLARFERTREHWDAPGQHRRFIDGDAELLPGIELIECGGHVPGHQAMLVRLPETGPVLLAIDAIPHSLLMDPDRRPMQPYDMDEEGVRASTRKLVDLARREGVALLVHGHDPGQWAGLQLLPDYYA